MLDVGCGSGILTVELASHFEQALGLDLDAEMLAEGARCATAAGITNIEWIRARGEDLPMLGLPTCKLVTFSQSFHWMDRERVAEVVYNLLEPDGALALNSHAHEGRPQPPGPYHPPIPPRGQAVSFTGAPVVIRSSSASVAHADSRKGACRSAPAAACLSRPAASARGRPP
jgi:SAM-dependent methyltransferase